MRKRLRDLGQTKEQPEKSSQNDESSDPRFSLTLTDIWFFGFLVFGVGALIGWIIGVGVRH
jgi:hypothetical protein